MNVKQLFPLLVLGSVSSCCSHPNRSAEFDALGAPSGPTYRTIHHFSQLPRALMELGFRD